MTVWVLTAVLYCVGSPAEDYSRTFYSLDAAAARYYALNDGDWDTSECIYLDPVLKEVDAVSIPDYPDLDWEGLSWE